jgi:hypothetical protein
MRKLVCGLAITLSMLPTGAHAQATLDTTQVTCANYLAMSPDQARVFSAWISGWFNQRWGYTTVGYDDFGRNVASVRQWSAPPRAAEWESSLANLRILVRLCVARVRSASAGRCACA